MTKFILILFIISFIIAPILAPRSEIWAAKASEIPNQGIDAPPEIKAGEVVSTVKKVFGVFSWFKDIINKIWSALTKAYYWLKEKADEPVNPEEIEIKL